MCERKRFQAPPKDEGKVKCNDFKITVKHLVDERIHSKNSIFFKRYDEDNYITIVFGGKKEQAIPKLWQNTNLES